MMTATAVRPVLAFLILGSSPQGTGPAPEFAIVSEHCYFLALGENGPNVGIVVTREGALMIDPPPGTELPAALEALKKLTSVRVRWVVHTNYRRMQSSGYRQLASEGAVVLTGRELDRLAFPPPSAASAPPAESPPAVAPPGESKSGHMSAEPTRFAFDGQMRLYPDNLEIRIVAVQGRNTTAGDVVVILPAERVLFAGDLYVAGSFPEIDAQAGEGDAVGWLQGLRQVIDAMPVLKSAMAQSQQELPPPPPEMEKRIEQTIPVIGGRGPLSNLQEMKDLLEAGQKLRAQVARAVAAKRTLKTLLASAGLGEYKTYGNLEAYARLLYEALSAGR